MQRSRIILLSWTGLFGLSAAAAAATGAGTPAVFASEGTFAAPPAAMAKQTPAPAPTPTQSPSPAPSPAPAPAPAPAPTTGGTEPAQTPAPSPAPAPTGAAGQDLTVEDSANPELVGALTKELGVTPSQAQGGAGALLGLAKSRLKADEFAKVSAALPGTDALLKAAPAVKGVAGMAGLSGGMGGALGLASLAGSFKQLGLSPDQAAKMVPALTTFVQSKGAGEAASLLGGVLK